MCVSLTYFVCTGKAGKASGTQNIQVAHRILSILGESNRNPDEPIFSSQRPTIEIQCPSELTLRYRILKDAKMIRIALLIVLAPALVGFPIAAVADEKPFVQPSIHRIELGGEGGWDYLSIDSKDKRLYVSRGNRVVVVDLISEKVIGELAEEKGT